MLHIESVFYVMTQSRISILFVGSEQLCEIVVAQFGGFYALRLIFFLFEYFYTVGALFDGVAQLSRRAEYALDLVHLIGSELGREEIRLGVAALVKARKNDRKDASVERGDEIIRGQLVPELVIEIRVPHERGYQRFLRFCGAQMLGAFRVPSRLYFTCDSIASLSTPSSFARREA